MHRFVKAIPKVALLVAVLALFVFVSSLSAAEGGGARVEMATSVSGGVVTYSITLINDSSTAIVDLYIAARVPDGATFQSASAPKGAGFRGVEDGSVVWISGAVPAKSKQGPFTFKAKTADGKVAASNVWVRYLLPKDTVLTATDVGESHITLAKVVAVNVNTDNEVFPDKKAAITLTSGYAQKNNEKIVTSGLDKVGVGTYVYLNSRDMGEGEKELKSWAWSLKAPSGSTAKLEGADTRNPRFYADRAGTYLATLVATDSDGRRAYSSVEITAGRYVGGDWCASCHNGSVMPDVVSKWQQTGHATKFVDTYAAYSATSDYCVRCHTVGYDETDKAGGFDDAVKLAGYNLSKGSFLSQVKTANKSIDDVMADPRVAQFANIQCENCHGPGGTSHTGSKSYETGVCDQCHGQNVQWRNSKHAIEPPLHMSEGESCVECHTSQGYVAVKIRGKEPVFPAKATATKKATIPDPGAASAIGCVTCHDPHTATYPFESAGQIKSLQLRLQGEVAMPNGLTVDAELSAVCITCHANKRDLAYKADYLAGNKVRGTHDNSQADVFYGAGAFDFGKSFGSSIHKSVVKEGCVECHMAKTPGYDPDRSKVNTNAPGYNKLGGHTWAMEVGGIENVSNACGSCHSGLTSYNRQARGDYDGDGKVEGVQDEVKGLLDLVAAKLPKDSGGEILSSTITKANTNATQRMALWNYWLIKNDGSNGVHNTRYAVEVLQETYFQLNGTKVPGAAAP